MLFTTDAAVTYKTRDDIFQVKNNLLEFLKSGFIPEQIALPLLIASADPSSSINEPSEIAFRKLGVDFDLIIVYDNISFIDYIILLFLAQMLSSRLEFAMQNLAGFD